MKPSKVKVGVTFERVGVAKNFEYNFLFSRQDLHDEISSRFLWSMAQLGPINHILSKSLLKYNHNEV